MASERERVTENERECVCVTENWVTDNEGVHRRQSVRQPGVSVTENRERMTVWTENERGRVRMQI
ncbi:hypothetical protein BVRB_5g126300 [Beta vulgaris subsp. vulgaris]|uniref:Uncharacterized protein n=1 Tax=Beta vulgaris subsp. vulgaris TaxID=3555 RepID=A0A0J8BC61_BETVV|nr:hypothetical protein BVRB_5g126300 [Beta vulgaris subsp. vulgaris]